MSFAAGFAVGTMFGAVGAAACVAAFLIGKLTADPYPPPK